MLLFQRCSEYGAVSSCPRGYLSEIVQDEGRNDSRLKPKKERRGPLLLRA